MIQGAECECGKKLVPYREICPKCGGKMDRAGFEEKGVVLTHTTLYAVPEGYEPPIKLAMIQLEGGANLICGYEGEEELSIGKKVRIESRGELDFCTPLQ